MQFNKNSVSVVNYLITFIHNAIERKSRHYAGNPLCSYKIL